jgi:hypothetical protein
VALPYAFSLSGEVVDLRPPKRCVTEGNQIKEAPSQMNNFFNELNTSQPNISFLLLSLLSSFF